MPDDQILETNSDFLVTQSTIKRNTAPDTILRMLRSRKATGELCFDLIEGGVRRIRLSERTKASEAERDEIRKILGMANGE
jgi:hypothetical protein